MEEKQQKAQSKDFNEIWNIHSEMNVTYEEWDEIFHNWDDPKNCEGRRRPTGCTICELIEKHGYVVRKTNGKAYGDEGRLTEMVEPGRDWYDTHDSRV